MAAAQSLGGEAQRVDIIDRALEIGGWSQDELAVESWYSGAARKYHLRSLADYAITICSDRGELAAATRRGVWRVVRGGIEPHPHGRVFTAGVGVVGAPIDDSWSAGTQSHLWFSDRSTQIGTGDHVFALAAGRGSLVVGGCPVARRT